MASGVRRVEKHVYRFCEKTQIFTLCGWAFRTVLRYPNLSVMLRLVWKEMTCGPLLHFDAFIRSWWMISFRVVGNSSTGRRIRSFNWQDGGDPSNGMRTTRVDLPP